jgi:hypothetical protein
LRIKETSVSNRRRVYKGGDFLLQSRLNAILNNRNMATYRHMIQDKPIEHVWIRILQLPQVDVLLDRLVFRPELRKASPDMQVMIESRGGESVRSYDMCLGWN